MRFRKIIFFKIVLFKIARNTQNMRILWSKLNQDVIFCVQYFFYKNCFLKLNFYSKSCFLEIFLLQNHAF